MNTSELVKVAAYQIGKKAIRDLKNKARSEDESKQAPKNTLAETRITLTHN